MARPEPKFKGGQVVKDTWSGKVGPISTMYFSEGDEDNKAEWAYSIDRIGWLFYPESGLEVVNGTA